MSYTAATIQSLQSLEALASGDSLLHRIAPTVKILFALTYAAIVVSMPRDGLTQLLPFAAFPVAAAALAGVPCRLLARRILTALPFVCFAGLANLWFDRTPMAELGGVPVTGGMISFAVLLVKAALTVAMAILLAATTPVNVLAGGMRRLRVPCVLTLQLLLSFRYLELLVSEAGTLVTAYRQRAPRARVVRWRDWPNLAGTLLLRSLDRAERIYQAMQCRCFHAGCVPRAARAATATELAGGAVLVLCCLLLRLIDLPRMVGELLL